MGAYRRAGPALSWMLTALLTTCVRGAQRGQWSNRTLGPDGPWNALEVIVGNDQTVTVYGGHMWESYFLDSSYCKSTTTGSQRCYAAEKSAIYYETQGTGSGMGIQYPPPDFWSESMPVKGGGATRWADDIYVGTDSSVWGLGAVYNVSMALLADAQLVYPSGDAYPLFAGCLAFGAAPKQVNQTFQVTAGTIEGATNLSLIAGQLSTHGKTESNSFGMHIGTGADPPVAGSLWYGGYDQNRVLNDVLAVPIEPDYGAYLAVLSDVSITILAGESPFSWTSKSGLLASGNSSMGNTLKVGVEACMPYLNLPKSTCDAIAGNLPVTYNEGLGLYLWNIESDDYSRIVSSASALTFSFPDPDNNSRTVNISVPFRHLNLTLEEPLVSSPVPYFPCNGGSNGHYALGRAFLQDAFFGTNFENAIFFLAQAPGPNVNTEDVVSIDVAATTVTASHSDLVKSWDGFWSLKGEVNVTSTNNTTSGGGASSSDTSNTTADNSSSSSRTALIAGLAGGLGGGLSLVVAGIFFACRRRNHKQSQSQSQSQSPSQSQSQPETATSYYDPKWAQPQPFPQELTTEQTAQLDGYPRAELATEASYNQQYELAGPHEHAYEMPTEGYHANRLEGLYSPGSDVTNGSNVPRQFS